MKCLADKKWLQENEEILKNFFPKTYTHVNNIDSLPIMFKFKLLGIDWRSKEDFRKVLLYLEKVGLILRDGLTIKRNPHSIFS